MLLRESESRPVQAPQILSFEGISSGQTSRVELQSPMASESRFSATLPEASSEAPAAGMGISFPVIATVVLNLEGSSLTALVQCNREVFRRESLFREIGLAPMCLALSRWAM